MGSVFISYRSTDRDFVIRLAVSLRENSFDVWLDQWQISGRKPYWKEIEDAVENCSHFLFVISPQSVADDSGAMTELYHAVQYRPSKVIVPIICKPTPFNSIPIVVSPGKFQIHDFTKLPYDEGLSRVMRALSTPQSENRNLPDAKPTKSTDQFRLSQSGRVIILLSFVILAGILIINGLNMLTGIFQGSPTLSLTLSSTPDARAEQILTETFEALTKIAQIVSPTTTLTATLSATASLTETMLDPLDYANQTFAARTDQAMMTIAAYTKTPTQINTATPNFPETAVAIVAATDAKSTANVMASYTKTPTSISTFTQTYVPTNTSMPAITTTSTNTSTPVPTLTSYPTLDEAQNPTTWQPIIRTFDYNGYSVEMVLVPAGSFMMGDNNSGQPAEQPVHWQRITQPFWIDRYEVTNEQFNMLGGIAVNKSNWTKPQFPREQITWAEANAFCEQKRGGALPTEAQWEWAARGPHNLQYPWGNAWDATKAVWKPLSPDGITNVGSISDGKSWVGAFDMSGNVWEWTHSLNMAYPYSNTDGRENQSAGSVDRILRGGSWFNSETVILRSAFRSNQLPTYNKYDVGFRCIYSF